MMTDIVSLKHRWSRRFGKVFDEDRREIKLIQSPDGRGFFRVMYSQKLEEWYLSPKGKARYDKPNCFFCDEFDEYHREEDVKIIKHLKVFFNLKFVMRNHWLIAPIKHRAKPTALDVAVLQKMAAMSGLSIFGNFRDSGASYPKHVHYQTLETEFPVASRPGRLIYDDKGVKVETLSYPVLVFRFSPQKDWTRAAINRVGVITTSQPGTCNLMFYGRDIYLIPRTKSVPANTDGFKFAAAEACGSIFTRGRRLFDVMDGEVILAALWDVCLPLDSVEAKHYEESLTAKMKEVK